MKTNNKKQKKVTIDLIFLIKPNSLIMIQQRYQFSIRWFEEQQKHIDWQTPVLRKYRLNKWIQFIFFFHNMDKNKENEIT